ncbi:hypothetical protein C8Q80DRAFT_1094590 [Daedaleopsis nitida]|nr:hypothetical protein C8Q80DRAFT_1094590 [Daedaleopsis nitida]
MSSPTSSRCVYDIPMTLDATLSHTNGLDPHFTTSRNKRHFLDCKEYIVGPIPPSDFLDFFLPPTTTNDKARFTSTKNAFASIPRSAETAADIYEPLSIALNKKSKQKSRCPGFTFDTPATRNRHTRRRGCPKPHICCYTQENLKHVVSSDRHHSAEFGYLELLVQVRPDPSQDLFVDPDISLDHASRRNHQFLATHSNKALKQELEDAFGQHIAHVVEAFARQYRLSLFTIAMSGSCARLLHWDRAGCVVSESFDIREQPDLFCEFLWRFSQTSSSVRGHDLTVKLAPSEETLFRDAITEYARSQLGQDEDLESMVRRHYKAGHVVAIEVLHYRFTATMENTRRFLVSRPTVSPLALYGSGTRGYWAVDTMTQQVVFLKDTWRRTDLAEVEGETLRRLSDLGVRNVPSLVWHGDVPISLPDKPRKLKAKDIQTTRHDLLASESWACQVDEQEVHVPKRRHYRLVMGTVGQTIKTVRGTDELLHSTYDVYTAMRDALQKDSRIHRDISVGNIILVQEPDSPVRKGYLIDWEMSCRIDESGDACESGRVGTWDFMSYRLLDVMHRNAKHRFQDDMESLLYVVLYSALLWQPHNLSKANLTFIISGMFEYGYKHPLGAMHGGSGKLSNAVHRQYTLMVQFGSDTFREWLLTVLNYHSPLPMYEESGEYKDKWSTPEPLDTYWATFLQTNVLESNNRVVHTLDKSDYYESISASTPSRGSSPHVSGKALGKRPMREAPDEAPVRRNSRRRAFTPPPVAGPSNRAAPSRSHSTPPLRRSSRIQEQKGRVQQADTKGVGDQTLRRRGPSKRKTRTTSRK